MGGLKQHQPPMTIDEQVENLKNIGLIVEDEEYAKRILNDISYFRLIKVYSLTLKSKNGIYAENVSFEQLVELYRFNANFRQIIFPEIEKVEINVRCRVANYFAEQYGVLGYLEEDNFVNPKYHQSFIDDIEGEIRRNSKAPFVKNFRDNYEGGKLPIYALVEVFSFGTLSKFYKNMKNSDKKVVAKSFGVGFTYLESWLESISYVRNICAHYGRLYNGLSRELEGTLGGSTVKVLLVSLSLPCFICIPPRNSFVIPEITILLYGASQAAINVK